MTTKKPQLTKEQLILEVWRKSGSQSAGAYELGLIQQALRESLGSGAVESPASLARRLADAAIPLRHPEVLEADSVWRESRLYELFGPGELDFRTLDGALESVGKLEDLRIQFEEENDEDGLMSLVEHVRRLKDDLAGEGDVEWEVGQWLTIWLQNPRIFRDWISLRRQSAEFLSKFGS